MTISNKLSLLQTRFLESAYVKDAQKGYVVVKEFNLSIDPDILELASSCWAQQYHHDTHIDAIVGLPDAGSRLVSILAGMLRVKTILPSKRSSTVPGAWQDVVSFTNNSFTMDTQDIRSHIGFVKPGMRVLLIDDVVAHGTTAIAAISALQMAGIEVIGLAVLFDKTWQHGVERVAQETGVEVFSLIRIDEITPKGEVVLKKL